jgi:hypothetical protein
LSLTSVTILANAYTNLSRRPQAGHSAIQRHQCAQAVSRKSYNFAILPALHIDSPTDTSINMLAQGDLYHASDPYCTRREDPFTSLSTRPNDLTHFRARHIVAQRQPSPAAD